MIDDLIGIMVTCSTTNFLGKFKIAQFYGQRIVPFVLKDEKAIRIDAAMSNNRPVADSRRMQIIQCIDYRSEDPLQA